jgi:hypothetical protein
MEALYCAQPVCFDDRLPRFSGFPEPFVPIWLVPILPIEAQFVRTHGWRRFETILDEADAHLMDLLRAPIVDHA